VSTAAKLEAAPATESADSPVPPPAEGGEVARSAGRGGLAIAGAKVAFILFGFAQQLILTRLLRAEGYGQLRTVLSVVSIVNNTVVAMSIQGVSRAVSQAPAGREDEALRATLRVHVPVAALVSLGFALLAGQVAAFEGAPHLTSALRLVALVVLLYGLYAPLVGSLNGRRRFLDQAGLDTLYSFLRTGGLAAGALLFAAAGSALGGVMGALGGFVAAAAVILPLAVVRAGVGSAGEAGPGVREYLRFLLPVAGGQILLNLLLFTDGLLLRRFAGAALSRQAADALAGVYSGAQQFSFLPYQLLISITFILFPMLARAQAEGDRAAVRSYTMAGVRLAMVLTAIFTGALSGLAPGVVRVVFPPDMWDGAGALRILSLGMGSLSVLGITCAALTSLGRAVDAAALTGLGVSLIAGGCSLVVPAAPAGLPMLTASATATAVALTLAAIAGGLRLRAVAGGFVAPLTLVRVLATLGACVAAGSRLPLVEAPSKIVQAAGVAMEGLAVVAVGLVVLVVSGEVGREDLTRLRAVVARKRKGSAA
jgi:stage V sporulation protein B